MDYLNDPVWLNRLGTRLNVGGNFLSAFSHINHGVQSKRAADAEAQQLETNAGQAQAASQIQALNVEDRTKQLTARALAVAAASGGGATDPSVVNTISRIAGEGAYRKAVALYQGEERARELFGAADAAEYRGKTAQHSESMAGFGGFIGAGTSLLKGYAREFSLRTKYGGAGPQFQKDDDGSAS